MRGRRVVSLFVVVLFLNSLLAGPMSFVGAAGQSANFETRSPSDDRGDVISITVHASKAATVNIGSPEQGFWVQVNVTKGTTTLDLNTYWADDPNEAISLKAGSIKGTPNVRIPSESGPLQPGVYDMNVTVDGVTQDIGSFTVEQRETGDAWTGVLPKPETVNPDDFETPNELRKAASATENGTVRRATSSFSPSTCPGCRGSSISRCSTEAGRTSAFTSAKRTPIVTPFRTNSTATKRRE